MKIEISNIEDCKSESVQLLTKIIRIEQGENDKLSTEVNKLRKKILKLEPIKNNYSALENAKNALESQHSTLVEEKNALESQYSTLVEEKKTLESQHSTLMEEKNALESQYSTLVEEKKALESQYSTLLEEKKALESQYSTLVEEKKELKTELDSSEYKLLHDKLSTIQLVLTSAISKLNDSQWKEFINAILTGIDNTISTITTVDESLDKIQVKNGWLTKLASLHWWSKESHVREFVPDVLNADSALHKIFDCFLEYLDANKIQISLPDVDFSSDLEQYDADYDEDPKWIKVLFPQYQPKDYILCEICFLSINSRKGQCLGFNVK